jgi:hypothetical protein
LGAVYFSNKKAATLVGKKRNKKTYYKMILSILSLK